MIEVATDQQATIFELAQIAAGMARQAFLRPNRPEGPAADDVVDAILPASPLAAEIFKTLIRCHVKNRDQRINKEFIDRMSGQIPGSTPGGPLGHIMGGPPAPFSEMGKI
jgi:hypothetical protein